jgi:hypothetical protein
MMATQQWGSHVPRARPKAKPKGYAEGGPVDPGGKDLPIADWLKPGGTSDQFLAARKTPGGTKSVWPNRTSKDPEQERHYRTMESLDTHLGALENEDEISGRPDPKGRYTHPEDRARYHGFAKGGPVKKPMFEGTKKDIAQDKAGAKKMGVSMKAYERTPKDKAQDKAGQRQMFGKRK